MNDFNNQLNDYISTFNDYASGMMNEKYFIGRESKGLKVMLEAMSYSLENGGKRIRPVLCLEFCRICGGDWKEALPFALSIEMIHTYSLIHDDLPCMDNDDMRRGKKSNHVVYGEANALLAGDGLLTLSFEVISSKCKLSPEKIVKAVFLLSKAAGCSGMIAGQTMDLENEDKHVSLDDIKNTDYLKTGEMIRVSGALGCLAAGADEIQKKAADKYCSDIGLAFQIVDDILDVCGNSNDLGKPVGSDNINNKSTYVSLLGLDKSKQYVKELTQDAIDSLSIFGDEASYLRNFALSLSERKF